jgi:hypothetical protein
MLLIAAAALQAIQRPAFWDASVIHAVLDLFLLPPKPCYLE